jgi:hypothetical protein
MEVGAFVADDEMNVGRAMMPALRRLFYLSRRRLVAEKG